MAATWWRYASSWGTRPRAPGLAAALVASLVSHLLGAAGLWLLPRSAATPPAGPQEDVIAVSLIAPAAPDNEAEAPGERDDSAPARHEPERRREPGRRAHPDGARAQTVESLSGPPSTSGQGKESARPVDVPPLDAVPSRPSVEDAPPSEARRANGLPEGDRRSPAAVDLSFDGLAADSKLRAVPLARDDSLLHAPPVETRRRRGMPELTAERARQTEAEENVERGRAPPLLYDYLRAARARLEPEATSIAEALPLGPALTVQGWARGYLSRAAESGGRSTEREALDSTIYDLITGGRRPDLFAAYNEATRQAAAGAEQRTAEVCLGVSPDRPVVVTLRQSSGHAALDRLATDVFEKAALTRPMAEDMRPGLACYRVRISAFRMPPNPTLAFGIKNGRLAITYPLERITKVTVELVSLDHGDAGRTSRLLRPR